MKVTVKSERRNDSGIDRLVFIADCGGAGYEFDPLAAALKDTGIGTIGGENLKLVQEKCLELSKTGIQRAESGARLRYFVSQAETATPEEVNALWDSIWINRQ
jgi:hypothetical protein